MINVVACLFFGKMVENPMPFTLNQISKINCDKGGGSPTLLRNGQKSHDLPFALNQISKMNSDKGGGSPVLL